LFDPIGVVRSFKFIIAINIKPLRGYLLPKLNQFSFYFLLHYFYWAFFLSPKGLYVYSLLCLLCLFDPIGVVCSFKFIIAINIKPLRGFSHPKHLQFLFLFFAPLFLLGIFLIPKGLYVYSLLCMLCLLDPIGVVCIRIWVFYKHLTSSRFFTPQRFPIFVLFLLKYFLALVRKKINKKKLHSSLVSCHHETFALVNINMD
jgi:hypothetical protein